MGQALSDRGYQELKTHPERVIGMGIDFINGPLYSHMVNDRSGYSQLHEIMQKYLTMTNDKLIITAKLKGISLVPLLSTVSTCQERVRLLSDISSYGNLRPEYYLIWPIEMADCILQYIRAFRMNFDFKESVVKKFNFDNFCHEGILDICKKIHFDNQPLGRAEDLLVEYLGVKIKSMYEYMKTVYPNVDKTVVFQIIEEFYSTSNRLLPALGGKRVTYRTNNYPIVPVIPKEDIDDIVSYLMSTRKISRNDALIVLRMGGDVDHLNHEYSQTTNDSLGSDDPFDLN